MVAPMGLMTNSASMLTLSFMASIGLNVIQVNFRGSGGYGKAFERAGYREWGRAMAK